MVFGEARNGRARGSAIRIALCRAGKRRNVFSFSFQARLWIRGQEFGVFRRLSWTPPVDHLSWGGGKEKWKDYRRNSLRADVLLAGLGRSRDNSKGELEWPIYINAERVYETLCYGCIICTLLVRRKVQRWLPVFNLRGNGPGIKSKSLRPLEMKKRRSQSVTWLHSDSTRRWWRGRDPWWSYLADILYIHEMKPRPAILRDGRIRMSLANDNIQGVEAVIKTCLVDTQDRMMVPMPNTDFHSGWGVSPPSFLWSISYNSYVMQVKFFFLAAALVYKHSPHSHPRFSSPPSTQQAKEPLLAPQVFKKKI